MLLSLLLLLFVLAPSANPQPAAPAAATAPQQQKIGCFKRGSCQKSTLVNVTEKNSAEECRRTCREEPDCKYFTFSHRLEICFSHSDCGQFADRHDNSISSDSSCDALVCEAQGLCLGGRLVGAQPSLNREGCVRSCREDSSCRWWSHHGERLLCLKADGCERMEANRTEFVSGQGECGVL